MVWQTAKPSGVRLENFKVFENQIEFKVAWDFSWNKPNEIPNNHDAAWVFAKFKDESGFWHPLFFDANNSWSGLAGSLIAESKEGQGLIIKRSTIGVGNVNDFFYLPLAIPVNAVELQLFAIEMVYVPTGAFYVGDAMSQKHFFDASTQQPFKINNEDDIPVDSVSGLWATESAVSANIPSNFPKGYQGFYAMKYEISQDQYVAFLNTLTINQQQNRVKSSLSSQSGTFAFFSGTNVFNRNGIIIQQQGNFFNQTPAIFAIDGNNNGVYFEATDGATRACNFLNYQDVLAYLDWAGLRPLTEFEFEKMARGSIYPIKHEFAWGTPYVIDANTLINDGAINEGVQETGNDSAGLASHGYIGVSGGLRNGFAAKQNTNRVNAGASYYGVMELSGNLWEYVVKAMDKGLVFSGNNGDGQLDADGNANQINWEINGGGFRGGAWNSGVVGVFRDLAISDRFYIDLATNNRRNTSGGRGVLSW